MKAISIRQPWAWAILHAGKRIENRARGDGRMPSPCRHRGPLLIHASAGLGSIDELNDSMDALADILPADAWDAFSLEYFDIGQRRRDGEIDEAGKWVARPPLLRGGIVGVCNVVAHVEPTGAVRERDDGESGAPAGLGPLDFRWHVTGSFGLVLANVRPLPFVPLKGALGLFNVPDEMVPAEARAA